MNFFDAEPFRLIAGVVEQFGAYMTAVVVVAHGRGKFGCGAIRQVVIDHAHAADDGPVGFIIVLGIKGEPATAVVIGEIDKLIRFTADAVRIKPMHTGMEALVERIGRHVMIELNHVSLVI